MSYAEAPNISADAGNPQVLSDPNSPEAIARRAREAEAQSNEDKRYDATPATKESFRNSITEENIP